MFLKNVSFVTGYWKVRYGSTAFLFTSFTKEGCGRKLLISEPKKNVPSFDALP